MKKVAILITHPIQYYVPIFQGLAEFKELQVKVFYSWGSSSLEKFDPGFNKNIIWDLPLLENYEYEFLENTAKDPGSHHFWGIKNPNIIQKIEEFNPDKLLVFGWSYQSHLKALRYFKGKIPIYFRGDSHFLNPQTFIKKALRKVWLKWVYSHIDYAISVGTNNTEYYRLLGLTSSQILLAGHAIDENWFCINETENYFEAQKIRADLGIPKSAIVFLYAGKFETIKRVDLILNAFKQLNNKSSFLLLVGSGIHEEYINTQVNEHIKRLDFQNQKQMPIIYRIADVFVLASDQETWGLAINEAMNCGLVIIASEKVGGAIDLIEEGKNGYIFKSGSIDSLLEKMMQILSNSSNIDLMKHFSLSKINDWSMKILINKFSEYLRS